MQKSLIFVILNILFISSLMALPSQTIFREVVAGSQAFSDIDPLFDAQKELAGFLYTDSAHNRLVVHDINSDTKYYFPLSYSPRKTILINDYIFDTLDLYTVGLSGNTSQHLSHLKIINNMITSEMTEESLPYYYVTDPSILSMTNTILGLRISNSKLLVESRTFVRIQTTGNGISEFVYPSTVWIDMEWLTPEEIFQAERVETGNLFGSSDYETAEIGNRFYQVDNSTPDSQIIITTFNSVLSLTDSYGDLLYEYATNAYDYADILIGNFQPSSAEMELLYFGKSCPDSTCLINTPHLSCYNIEDSNFTTNWQNNNTGTIKLAYIYSERDNLVVTRNNNKILMLNYLNGQFTDSLDLPKFDIIRFYESDGIPRLLHLITKSYDTIRTFDLYIATGIDESLSEPDIPSTFTLYQNHPNPFNGDTRLEFSNEQIQHLSFKIYNILGQEIKSLAERTFSPGQYSFYWNGKNEEGLPQSTGVYFARLASPQSSQLIKLIYLK